jgi:hypothetical protein
MPMAIGVSTTATALLVIISVMNTARKYRIKIIT